MNILFHNSSDVSPIKGGTERITDSLVQGFKAKGHHCFLTYETEIDPKMPKTAFDAKLNIFTGSLEKFIVDHAINVVIIQKMTRLTKDFYEIRQRNGLHYQILSVLHFNPGYALQLMTFRNALREFHYREPGMLGLCKSLVRVLTYPVYKILYPLRDQQLYREVYQYSDKTVLLSKNFKDEFVKYAHIQNGTKLAWIPNALSYPDFFPMEDLDKKEKRVLIVSRLSERQKRISAAIKIWSKVEKNPAAEGWQLDIVGAGEDEALYHQMVKDLGLQHVKFYGRQSPKPFYQQSSIFMMTSSFEGWGLTLTEAQQMGCVPIAYHTFASLTDIITDGENGCVIPERDEEQYVKRIEKLMSDEALRRKMEEGAINSAHRFSQDAIVDQWERLMNGKE